MKAIHLKALHGPNIWSRYPVVEASVDFDERKESDTAAVDPYEALSECFPELAVPRTAPADAAAGGPEMLMARATADVALELQRLARAPGHAFSAVRRSGPGAPLTLVFGYGEERVASECLKCACELCLCALSGKPFDLAAAVRSLRASAGQFMLGPSTRCIVTAAQRRKIPIIPFEGSSIVQLGYGKRQRRIRAAETDPTPAVAEGIAQDKQLTRELLEGVGVPVPEGYPATDAEDAWKTAVEHLGLPVVVKPRYGNQGRGVAARLSTLEEVKAGFEAAEKEGPEVVVEKYAEGADYRLLVVDGKVVAAARRDPACVVGDGERTVRALVEEANLDPRRGDDHGSILSKIPLDDIALQVLAAQGYSPESVPPAGAKVLIRRNANLSTGGTATDVTDAAHPRNLEHAVAAAAIVGLDIAGVDIVARDISVPLECQQGMVLEVNAAPGLRMHFAPSHGTPRDVGKAIVDMLFRPGENGRIPIAAVTGTNGKTTVARFLAHLVGGSGRYVGMTCTDGIFLNGRRICSDDCAGPVSARLVLMNADVEVAVLETARGGILRDGLGFDECDVAVVTNIAEGDHLGQNGVETAEDLAKVKRTIVEAVGEAGTAVLNAADPLVTAMASRCRGRVVYFALDGANPVIERHRSTGGAAVFTRAGHIIVAEDDWEERLAALDRVPMTFRGRVAFETENALAALAAAWAMGVESDVMRERAESFSTSMHDVPGRMNVLEIGGGTVICDYGHNAPALSAILRAFTVFPHRRRTALYTMAGDRRDGDIVHIGELLGDAFDSVILYEASTMRNRAPGEIARLIRDGLGRGGRVREVAEVQDPIEAMRYALDRVGPGDLLLLQADNVDEAVQFVTAYSKCLQPEPLPA